MEEENKEEKIFKGDNTEKERCDRPKMVFNKWCDVICIYLYLFNLGLGNGGWDPLQNDRWASGRRGVAAGGPGFVSLDGLHCIPAHCSGGWVMLIYLTAHELSSAFFRLFGAEKRYLENRLKATWD